MTMTRAEAASALNAANSSIAIAVLLIRQHQPILDQFFKEERLADSIMPIVDPTLWRDRERQETAALLSPIYRAALMLLGEYDAAVGQLPHSPQ